MLEDSWRRRWFDHLRRRRTSQMARQFEDNLSMLARRARSGRNPLELIRLAKDQGQGGVFREEFSRVLGDYSVGTPLGTALRESHRRVPDPVYGRFITAMSLARETGGDLAHGLSALEGIVRERRELRSRVREETAEARYSAIIVAAIPLGAAVYGLWARPDMMRPLLAEPVGRAALFFAVASWFCGLFAIRFILARAEELCR
ncbi:MAG: type II secretion system F family protein [Clostridia bacterium]